MTIPKRVLILCVITLAACGSERLADAVEDPDKKIVIAHRGASGYLPEHSIAAKAMAYAQGVDFIEQDLVMTKDDEIIVLHDHLLDTISNVRDVYPERARADGSYYVVDFTLAEIKQLQSYERFSLDDGEMSPVFPDRFPLRKSTFAIHTFAEEIELIQGLNKSTGDSVGIYPEIKSPAFHRAEGKDISRAVLTILKDYGYTDRSALVYLQCFDPEEVVRIHDELMPATGVDLPLIQLIGDADAYQGMLSLEGMQRVAKYVDGIGPPFQMLVDDDPETPAIEASEIMNWVAATGLQVHAYTFRREAEQIPSYAENLEALLEIFLFDIDIDGVFVDFPDIAVELLDSQQ